MLPSSSWTSKFLLRGTTSQCVPRHDGSDIGNSIRDRIWPPPRAPRHAPSPRAVPHVPRERPRGRAPEQRVARRVRPRRAARRVVGRALPRLAGPRRAPPQRSAQLGTVCSAVRVPGRHRMRESQGGDRGVLGGAAPARADPRAGALARCHRRAAVLPHVRRVLVCHHVLDVLRQSARRGLPSRTPASRLARSERAHPLRPRRRAGLPQQAVARPRHRRRRDARSQQRRAQRLHGVQRALRQVRRAAVAVPRGGRQDGGDAAGPAGPARGAACTRARWTSAIRT